jgi:hypothetical protein
MIIRQNQMDAFDKHSSAGFETSAANYLRETFPEKCEAIGSAALPAIVSFGRKQAEAHQFRTERTIVMYLHLMFMLGSRFDSDPLFPAGAEILNDKEIAEEEKRMNLLWGKASEYGLAVLGPEDEYLDKALKNLDQEAKDGLPAFTGGGAETYMFQRLDTIFPEKISFLGEPAIRTMIRSGFQRASAYGLAGRDPIYTYIVLMLMLGTDFDSDPQYPWAGSVLRGESDPAVKAKRLQPEAVKYLSVFLEENAAGSI